MIPTVGDGADTGGDDMNTLTGHVRAYIAERIAVGKFTGRTPRQVHYRLTGFAESFGNRPIEQLGEKAVLRWLATIEHLAQASRSAYLSTVRCFTAWLTRRSILRTDPCRDIEAVPRPRRVPRALPHEAVTACLQACHDDRDKAIIMLAVGCGLRRAEIARLRWIDYDDHSRTLFVKGKGSNERIVPVPAEVRRVLAPIRGQSSAPVISPLDGPVRNLSPFTIWGIVDRILREAGVKLAAYDGISTHAFRHTAASDVLDECGDLRTVQQMLGHADLKTTAIYLRIAALGDVASAMEGRDYERGLPDVA